VEENRGRRDPLRACRVARRSQRRDRGDSCRPSPHRRCQSGQPQFQQSPAHGQFRGVPTHGHVRCRHRCGHALSWPAPPAAEPSPRTGRTSAVACGSRWMVAAV
jgi:hypothetical protein